MRQKASSYVAVDVGASNGRVLLGRLMDRKLEVEEIFRFPNGPVSVDGEQCWDIPAIHESVLEGLRLAAGRSEGHVDGIGCVAWGADYGLLDPAGQLLGKVYSYRDSRSKGMLAQLPETSLPGIFERTAAPFDECATLGQLLAERDQASGRLAKASCLLFVPGILHNLLGGRKVAEFTMASQSQMFDVSSNKWDDELCGVVGCRDIMPEAVAPATVIGELEPGIAARCGLENRPPLIATATHDTAAAAFAMPPGDGDRALISSGTWVMVGCKTTKPVVPPEAIGLGMGNYGGADNNIFIKGVTGLWLLQECRRTWAREGDDYGYEELVEMARAAGGAHASLVQPNDPRFANPDNMVEEIRAFCRGVGDQVPETPGQVARCIFESIAIECQRTLERISEFTGKNFVGINVLGGGSRNRLLNGMIADATGLPVTAGPAEATAIGNILLQAKATGALESLAEAPQVVADSFDLEQFP